MHPPQGYIIVFVPVCLLRSKVLDDFIQLVKVFGKLTPYDHTKCLHSPVFAKDVAHILDSSVMRGKYRFYL